MSTETDAGAAAPASDTVVSTPAETTTTNDAPQASFEDRMTADLQATYEKLHPARGPDGKFAAKEAEPETNGTNTEAPEAAASETKPAVQPEEKTAEPAKPAIEPPNSWTAEQKAKWATVPLDTQEYILSREAESHKAITRLGEEKKQYEQAVKSYEPLGQVINAYQAEFQKRNVPPVQGIQMLLDAQRALDQNPLGAIVQIAQSYGINLAGLLQGQNAQASDGSTPPAFNPEVIALRNELAQIKSHLTEQQQREFQAQQRLQAQEQAKEQANAEALQKEIADFAKDKPHFEAVKKSMAALLNVGEAETLADAYEKATFANPEIRQRILADQRKAEEEKRVAEAAKKAKDAQKSATVNVRSDTARGNSPKSIDDTLRETAARLYGQRVA